VQNRRAALVEEVSFMIKYLNILPKCQVHEAAVAAVASIVVAAVADVGEVASQV
jgi:hypothetical protein